MKKRNFDILLNTATRDQLIRELGKRKSITSLKVCSGNGATIKSIHGNIAVDGEAYIFVITPN